MCRAWIFVHISLWGAQRPGLGSLANWWWPTVSAERLREENFSELRSGFGAPHKEIWTFLRSVCFLLVTWGSQKGVFEMNSNSRRGLIVQQFHRKASTTDIALHRFFADFGAKAVDVAGQNPSSVISKNMLVGWSAYPSHIQACIIFTTCLNWAVACCRLASC